jgi:hypothetical protein
MNNLHRYLHIVALTIAMIDVNTGAAFACEHRARQHATSVAHTKLHQLHQPNHVSSPHDETRHREFDGPVLALWTFNPYTTMSVHERAGSRDDRIVDLRLGTAAQQVLVDTPAFTIRESSRYKLAVGASLSNDLAATGKATTSRTGRAMFGIPLEKSAIKATPFVTIPGPVHSELTLSSALPDGLVATGMTSITRTGQIVFDVRLKKPAPITLDPQTYGLMVDITARF